MTPADRLAAIGRALYGERWQSELARALNVADRTVRRWIAGEMEPSQGVWTDLRRVVTERAQEIARAKQLLD